MIEWNTWIGFFVAIAIALVVNVVTAIAIKYVISAKDEDNQWFRTLIVRLHPRIQLLLALVGLWVAAGVTKPGHFAWWPAISHLFAIAVILAGAWLLSGLSSYAIGRLMTRYSQRGESHPEFRRMHTQLQVIRRLINALIGVVAIGMVLFSFPEVRAVGTSVLASAGIVSIIAGLAAQTTLGNLIAGIQLAFTDSIRVGDVVVIEGEWGRIGEITLTYVVVEIWDERALILPCTYFANQPYENWTRSSDEVLGIVYIDVDWQVPVAAAREKFDQILATTDLWDGRASNLRVTGAEDGLVTLRLVVSAKDSSDQWSLRCHVREEMVRWIQQEYPEAIPTTRVLMPRS